MVSKEKQKLIHLLYSPTMYCNLGCSYCYLGEQTFKKSQAETSDVILNTLDYALKKFESKNVVPFNVSLHGGEVTTLSVDILRSLFERITQHYMKHMDLLNLNGFNKFAPHIKTNLYNFDRLYDLFDQYKVSISASVDIPLSLHVKYRLDKAGNSSLEKTIDNLKLLAKYPHKKKVSSTLFKEHIEKLDELVNDIRYLDKSIGFDMNLFNLMIGFESKLAEPSGSSFQAMNELEQVQLYNRLKQEFIGSNLEYGLKKHWFDEFTPSYCTNALNCGEKFFLLQSNGDIYSCVRSQGVEPFFYGNIFKNSVDEILTAGKSKIIKVHQRHSLDDDCNRCNYLHLCKTGCAFVKNEQNNGKSYTCLLQKEIYKDSPILYPPIISEEQQIDVAKDYKLSIHPQLVTSDLFEQDNAELKREDFVLPSDIHEDKNTLSSIIQSDDYLKRVYCPSSIKLTVDQEDYSLSSQILKMNRLVINLDSESSLILHIKKSQFDVDNNNLHQSTLYLMMLRDTSVNYGDEDRSKQEHIFTYQLYYHQLKDSTLLGSDFVELDLLPILSLHKDSYQSGVLNNFFVTTNVLRDYHYKKQKSNAFYHLQAINLPFQNFEFYWL